MWIDCASNLDQLDPCVHVNLNMNTQQTSPCHTGASKNSHNILIVYMFIEIHSMPLGAAGIVLVPTVRSYLAEMIVF